MWTWNYFNFSLKYSEVFLKLKKASSKRCKPPKSARYSKRQEKHAKREKKVKEKARKNQKSNNKHLLILIFI